MAATGAPTAVNYNTCMRGCRGWLPNPRLGVNPHRQRLCEIRCQAQYLGGGLAGTGMRGSWYPFGYRDYSDREDMLAQAEVGRLILDNSRDSDGRMRRNNAGYFAEIAPMAGLGIMPTGWSGTGVPMVDPASTPYGRERYATPTPVGPTGPIFDVPVPVSFATGQSGSAAGNGSGSRQSLGPVAKGGLVEKILPWLTLGGVGLVFAGMMMSGVKRRRRR